MGILTSRQQLPPLKSFTLTHILYDPTKPLSIPLTLLSLSPIFLFVSYFTLIIFTRRLTLLILALGQLGNEALNMVLKEWWKGERPFLGFGEVGEGWGMPSSHSQAAGFLGSWGLWFWITLDRRSLGGSRSGGGREGGGGSKEVVRRWRGRIYLFGLGLWSVLVAYSRYYLHYHSTSQVLAGYTLGLGLGSLYFGLTEYVPLYHPRTILGQVRQSVEDVWTGVGGVGGWDLGGAEGGWGEGRFVLGGQEGDGVSRMKTA